MSTPNIFDQIRKQREEAAERKAKRWHALVLAVADDSAKPKEVAELCPDAKTLAKLERDAQRVLQGRELYSTSLEEQEHLATASAKREEWAEAKKKLAAYIVQREKEIQQIDIAGREASSLASDARKSRDEVARHFRKEAQGRLTADLKGLPGAESARRLKELLPAYAAEEFGVRLTEEAGAQ